MQVVVAGASGLIGTALTSALRDSGHEVIRLVRRPAKSAEESTWSPSEGQIDAALVQSADAVVNLAGASIGDKRLTKAYARVVLESRLETTGLLARTLADKGSGALIQGSAMGYYGLGGEEVLDEQSPPGHTLLSGIVEQWEAAAAPAVKAGVTVTWARSGLVLAPHGGLAARLLPLVRLGVLRSLGDGSTWHSWISLHDEVRALEFLLTAGYAGPVNLVAPEPARDRDLIRALREPLGKTWGLPVPAFALKAAIGPAASDLLDSQRAVPAVLQRLGFAWDHPDVKTAGRWVMHQAGLAGRASPPRPAM